MKNRVTRTCVLLLAALLAGCSTLMAPSTPPSSTPVAPYRDAIALSGRMAVNYQKDGRNESLSGKFNWQQSANRTDVSLASPLGQTIALIEVTPDAARLTQGNQPARVAADIDALSAQALGWHLPVSGLRHWLQGYALSADGTRFRASPENNNVTTRDGWRLHFVSWQDDAASVPQPKRIDAERSTGDQVALRIVIDGQP
ncbi:MAG: outer membrane lipoprotein LolB [Janthinobacterium sp.]|jgi:outer membrane lipoprotein LolB